jgi:RNase adapter protein RapZ
VRIVVITGLSGSGKSTAIRALEDLGYFCIDNLPAVLLPKLTELGAAAGDEIHQFALVIDAREGRFLGDAPRAIEEARKAGHLVEVLFLDADDDALIRRFSDTRRRHPLAPEGAVSDGIAAERKLLGELRRVSDQTIDTSSLTVHELKGIIQARFAPSDAKGPALTVISFGYRYGLPAQADLVFDVRFLPNPFFVESLKGFDGNDPRVAAFVLDRPEAREFLDKTMDMLNFLLPQYRAEGKAYLSASVGCTGGKHRSVAVANALAERLRTTGREVRVWHRDTGRE